MVRLFSILSIFIVFLTGCTGNNTAPEYITGDKDSQYVAVFARVGADVHEFEYSNNHLLIHKSFKTVNVDDLAWTIYPCERKDTLFCLYGGLPIFLPSQTGIYEYNTDRGQAVIELIAPSVETLQTGKKRDTCDLSVFTLKVTYKAEGFEYVVSRLHGIVSITKTTQDLSSDSWYLVSGKLMDVAALCNA